VVATTDGTTAVSPGAAGDPRWVKVSTMYRRIVTPAVPNTTHKIGLSDPLRWPGKYMDR
jgi:hypothetical protein